MAAKNQTIQPVIVSSYQDLLRVINPFLPNSTASIRKLLLDGFTQVKHRLEYENAQLNAYLSAEPDEYLPSKVLTNNPDDIHMWVDRLIKDRLNGKRTGMLISWKLKDGDFEFDPFTGELSKVTE